MQIEIYKQSNLNSITESQWKSFCEYIGPFIEAYAKEPAANAMVNVAKDGETVTINFDIGIRESLQMVKVKFDKFECKSWTYYKLKKKIENRPVSNITLSWQVFLTKALGPMYNFELEDFYKNNNKNVSLIKTLIKNSSNDFKF